MTQDELVPSELVAAIYDAAIDPRLWIDVPKLISQYVGSHQSLLFLPTARREAVTVPLSHGIDPDIAEAYAQLLDEDVWLQRALQLRSKSVFRSEDFTDLQEYRKTAFFQEICKPSDVAHMAGAIGLNEHGAFLSFSCQRSEMSGPFTDRDLSRIRTVLGHLRRAIFVQRQVHGLRAEGRSLRFSLDQSSIAIFLFNAAGKAAWWNTEAEALLRDNDGFRLTHGRIITTRPDERRLLASTIATATRTTGGQAGSAAERLTLTRPSGKLPYQVTVSALGRCSDSSSAAAFVIDPERPPEVSSTALQAFYGLTPAEARICQHLMAGKCLSDAAEMAKVSIATVRTQLKAVFRKCRVSSQAQLVARLARVQPLTERVSMPFPSSRSAN